VPPRRLCHSSLRKNIREAALGFRYRKSVRIVPGVRLNLSKSGTSLSVGRRGFTTNFSKRGRRTTISLPGTGLSYTTSSPAGSGGRTGFPVSGIAGLLFLIFVLAAVVSAIFR